MEMQHNDHLAVAGLEYGVFDVVVKDVDFISAYRREAETWRRQDSDIDELYLIEIYLIVC